jgi:hypothetical protein
MQADQWPRWCRCIVAAIYQDVAEQQVSSLQPSLTRGAYVPQPLGNAKTVYDNYTLPGNTTVGAADDKTFRNHLKVLLKTYDPHWGREKCAEAYAAEYDRISELGAKAAIADWHNENGGS